jgi:hypothetical protein
MFAFETTDQRGRWEVGLGSTASVLGHCRDIRFTPNSGAKADVEWSAPHTVDSFRQQF